MGCGEVSQVMGATWHQKAGWKAEDYFTDQRVVALCHAIEADDLAEIDRAIAGGADVNAKGKGNMTPLLWAYPDNKLARFKKLLEHGANPNIVIESDFNSHGGFQPGDSVTHLACRTEFPGYFETVFEHSGDPNLPRTTKIVFNETPLFSVITGASANKQAEIATLIKIGAKIDHKDDTGTTPVMTAVGWGGQYNLALILLDAGADYKVYLPKSNTRLVHLVAGEERRRLLWAPQQAVDYEKLVKWLGEHGESIEEANADIKRWQSWIAHTGEYRRKLDAEIAEREARETREKEATKKAEQRP
jgi:uncharacterized protein